MSSWFRGLRFKLLLMIAVPLVVLGGLTGLSYKIISEISKDLRTAALVRMPLATESGRMSEGLQGALRNLWAVHGSGSDTASRKLRKEKCLSFVQQYDEAAKAYDELPHSAKATELYKDVPVHWAKVKATTMEALALLDANTHENDEKARLLLVDGMRADAAAVDDALSALEEFRTQAAKVDAEEALASADRNLILIAAIGTLTALGLVLFGLITAVRLAGTFGSIAHDIGNSATEVGTASSQLSDASQKLSAGASEAASSLEETVASLEELSGMVKRNADNSSEAGRLSLSARTSAEEGELEVRQLVTAMGDIASSSRKIEEIINVIDDIAFQTNLLALNAAVEAARAGEQGRGFAVVAEAVRNLAQRSGEAAKNITSLISESVDKVSRGSEIADRSGEVLKQIVVNSKKVADLTSEIAQASREQASGIEQISKAMNQLDQATQGNAASAEETASSSEQLAAEAESLHVRVRELVHTVEGRYLESAPPKVKRTYHHKPAANVVKFEAPKSKTPVKSEEVIPFDDHHEAKVANLDGF